MENSQDCIIKAKQLRQHDGKRICFVSGNFNIIHPGHLRFLLFAKEQADILVVGLYDKASSISAFFSNEERNSALSALSFVDEVVVLNNSLPEFISALKPDVIVKGKEWETLTTLSKQWSTITAANSCFHQVKNSFPRESYCNSNCQRTQGLQGNSSATTNVTILAARYLLTL